MANPQQPQVRVGVGVFVLRSSNTEPTNPSFLIGMRKGSHGAGTYALPGGHLEFGETTEECAAREVLEETGLQVSNLQFLTATNDYMEAEGKHYVTLFMVGVRDSENEDPRVLEPEKCEGWEWITWKELLSLTRGEKQRGGSESRELFVPLWNLVKQRSDVIATVKW